ncbi:acetoin dehydrogenase [Acetivibrio straminisolvens JCM 21531]|uniref:Acetoin dehydrogenase n=2 Tax=Acetivibrio straminisolvens TaxID=253314 RepID=W4V4T9_9FIRM|nr:acetoin dehydrogenase [Acetivibrio straminisolvens JCM 21531]
MVPIAAGLALASKMGKKDGISLAFIGDGTLGEGILYETMNIASKWNIPILIICENNYYAQSTKQELNLSGDIVKRAECFDIKVFKSNTWELEQLFNNAKESINYVRTNGKPAFHLVDTYRLNAHSKGDDYRDKSEIEMYYRKDPLNVFRNTNPDLYQELLNEIDKELDAVIEEETEKFAEIRIDEYYDNPEGGEESEYIWKEPDEIEIRQSDLIYSFFKEEMRKNEQVVFIGEDVLAPYGGAFKISKDLSTEFPERVLTTPISEAAITGISNGLALAGYRPFLEIMFGDFITLCLDQVLNHSVKFFHMYNKRVNCPIVLRTPMGGRRGYGPTHSQTLDKLLLCIDNIKVISLNSLTDPRPIYKSILENEKNPVIVIENKADYAKKITKANVENYKFELAYVRNYPIVRIRPIVSRPTATIVTYGGMSSIVVDCIATLFYEYDVKAEVIILSKIKPVDYDEIIRSTNVTGHLFVVEEGSACNGIGSEIIASVLERTENRIYARRIASVPVPVPANKKLEEEVLTNRRNIIQVIGGVFKC